MSVTVPHTKAARHALVTSLLTRGTVHSQQQLAELLTAEGVTVTQATLSRDLVELRAVKIRTPSGALAYAVPAEGSLRTTAPGPDGVRTLTARSSTRSRDSVACVTDTPSAARSSASCCCECTWPRVSSDVTSA